jgi:hypothetical protein
MEIDSDTYFEPVEPPKQSEEYNFLEGICPKCLDTSFVHTVKNGILGIAYTTFTQDASGKPIRKLMICNHQQTQNI